MKKQYGPKKAKKVFYSSKNKGKISGVENMKKSAKHMAIRKRANKY